MSTLAVPAIVMASVTFYVGFYHLLIYLRQTQHRENLTFALSCLAMALYDVSCAGLYSVTSAAQGVHWQRAQVAALSMVAIAFPWFVFDYLSPTSQISPRSKKWLAAFSVYFALSAIFGMVDRSGLYRPMDQLSIKRIHLSWGTEIVYYEMVPGPLTNLQSIVGLAVFVYVLWTGARVYRSGHRQAARPLLLSMTIFFASAVSDTAVASDLYQFVYTLEYAYMGMVLLMTYALTSKAVEAAAMQESLRESEATMRALLEAIPDAIFRLDKHGTYLSFVPAEGFETIVPPIEFIGKNQEKVLPPELAQQARHYLDQALQTGEVQSFEYSLALGERTTHYEARLVVLGGDEVLGIVRDITARQQAEEALREGEEHYRNLYETALVGLWRTRISDGMYIRANDTTARMLGFTGADDLIGKVAASEFYSSAGRTDFIEQLYRHGELSGRERRYVLRDGTEMDIALSAKIYPERGYIEGVIIDITKRKRAEEALRESEERYRQSVENSPNPIFSVDREGIIQTWNPACERFFQYRAEEMVAQPYHKLLWSPKDQPVIEAVLAQVWQGGSLGEYDMTYRCKDGTQRITASRLYPLRDHGGNVQGGVFANTDITARVRAEEELKRHRDHLEELVEERTAELVRANETLRAEVAERKRAEEALRESEERYRVISEIIPDWIYADRIKPDGAVTPEWTTGAFTHITGFTPDEVHGRDWLDFVHTDDHSILHERMPALLSGESTVSEYRFISKGGETRWLRDHARPVWDQAQGRVVRVYGAAQDITERKRAEEELKAAQEELIRQERLSALGQLTATVAHEIRNPLGTVRTAVFAIGDAIARDETHRVERALQLAERNIVRCDDIITELLDYTRERVLQLELTHIDTWLDALLDEQDIPKGIVCTRELSAGVEVPIDREHLRRAVINVVENGIHALQDEASQGTRLTVGTRVVTDRAASSRLEMRISDTGCGIPADVLDRIFEPLFSTKSFGVGLGMPVAKNILEQHGGGIEIESKVNEGTTVMLWFPVQQRIENQTDQQSVD